MDKPCSVRWCVALVAPNSEKCRAHADDDPDNRYRPIVSKELIKLYEATLEK
jgi:hypothetical protein